MTNQLEQMKKENPIKIRLYGVFDKKDGIIEVFQQNNDMIAIRNFSTAINNGQQTSLAMYPEDFELWKLANIEQETGDVEEDRRKLAEAKDYKKGGENQK